MAKTEIDKADQPLYSLTIGEYIELNRKIFAELKGLFVQDKSPNRDEVLNIDQASMLINLAKPTIYGLTSKNLIPFIKKGKKLHFIRSELIAWLVEGRRETNAELRKEAEIAIFGTPKSGQ